MKRRQFVRNAAMATCGIMVASQGLGMVGGEKFPIVRVGADKRKFTSKAVEELIKELQKNVTNRELGWLFGNCFPNTLDTTVDHTIENGKPDTYVITGDIDAMWLRDSSAQVWPYVALCDKDPALKLLIAGVINRQTKCIIKDPYANAFYKDEKKVSEWKDDQTLMQPGIHEHKWEIDSLCYPIRLAYGYYQQTRDIAPFDAAWREAMKNVVKTFKEQQRWTDKGPYSFMRSSPYATDSVPLGGYGYPAKPNGLICSMFRPSDDATIYPYLIPSNIFALSSLRSLKELCKATGFDSLDTELDLLIKQVSEGLNACAKIRMADQKQILAYEVNGFGSYNLMDDANVPSLLSLKYLVSNTAKDVMDDTLYQNTRNFVLSANNPFYFKGAAAEGVGGPHAGMDMIWPLGITMRGLTSTNDAEIKQCLVMLQKSHAGTGFMHESFHKDDFAKFSRPWFAWANTLFGEFVWKVYREHPKLLN